MRRLTVVAVLSLFAITLAAYLPAIAGGFIWDDDDYVTENATLRDLAGLRAIWLDPSATPQYYPLVHSTFWVEYQLWQLWPTGYHLTNVMIHAVSSVLLWRLLRRLAVPGAWFAALVFAIHPVHVESVAWITERKNVLSGLFYLAAVLCYLRFSDFSRPPQEERGPVRWRWYFAALLCFLGGLLSKTVVATLPAALLVMIWWKQGRLPRRDILVSIPMFILGIGFGLVTVWLEKNQVGASGIDWQLSFVERCLIAGRAIVFYAGKLVWPAELIFTYPRWQIDDSQAWQYLYPAAVIAVIVVLAIFQRRIGRGPLAAVLLFAGTLFPALGFFDVYPMRFSFVADHFQYLASIAIIALVVGSVTWWLQRRSPESPLVTRGAAVLIALVLVMLTWQQGKIYAGLEVLWRDTLAKNPSSFMAHNNLGALLNRRGDYAEAEPHLRESIRLKPNFADSVINLAKAREGQGDLDEALQLYQEALELEPNSVAALNGLGAVYGMTGQNELSEQMITAALRLNPNYAMGHANLATLLASQGQMDAAIAEFEVALRLDPTLNDAKTNLARVLMAKGDHQRAEAVFKELLAADPQNISTLLNLGVIAANTQRYQTAIGYFEQVLKIDPQHVSAHYNLGAMYDTVGDADRSQMHFQTYERLRDGN